MDPALEKAFNDNYLIDEEDIVNGLLAAAEITVAQKEAVRQDAHKLVEAVRARPDHLSPLERFLKEYDLSTEEGVLLMCLSETLLRIPDADTANTLIADKIKDADWEKHLGSHDLLVNASTWGLMLTGHLLPEHATFRNNPVKLWKSLVSRVSEPVIRESILLSMRIIGDQFVLGETIEEALKRAAKSRHPYEDFSFDMLGEAALTDEQSQDYLTTYLHAIEAIGKAGTGDRNFSISVKLSALCPRFEVKQWQLAHRELSERLHTLAVAARDAGIQLTVDAEECDRLELTLAVFESVFSHAGFRQWQGFGLAVQAYQKRAQAVLAYLDDLACSKKRTIPVRLVKGAYWDTEIKLAQVQGLAGFPVFTRKCNTDLCYQSAVMTLAGLKGRLFPQFATHNAYTAAFVKQFFSPDECEFQRLHGMGETLYEMLNLETDTPWRCRVYAPVGNHDDLLPYLVRRLLENGANSSFVHRIADEDVPVEAIVSDPAGEALANKGQHKHPHVALPADLFGDERQNSAGINFADRNEVTKLLGDIQSHAGDAIGKVESCSDEDIIQALKQAQHAWQEWDETPADQRAALLERCADLMQEHRAELMALCIHEGGKTVQDAHNEIREGIDLLRYYAAQSRRLFGTPVALPGPVGESNTLRLRGKGVFCCISPWNFPIAIFTGQIAAALAAGNTVLAKPAGLATATGRAVIQLFHEAGIPPEALGFIPADGETITRLVLEDERIAGVAFTGSNHVAKDIEATLAGKKGAISTLIAETGGINAMLVDSSALPEQVVRDVVYSAFNSAGQRCSALRVLFLQEEIADKVTAMIRDHMAEFTVGDPGQIETDIGPVISESAREELQEHINQADAEGGLIYQYDTGSIKANGCFVGPALISLDNISNLQHEVFGPVLHIIRYKASRLMAVCDGINETGFGLTFGIHSRINHRIRDVSRRIRAGNVYVNRNMVGAVVETQPFGGSGMSGTGPKAGGPHYLLRFASEQTVSNNTAAIGGDPHTFSISD